MTLHPIPSEFIRGKFCFLFYQCTVRSEVKKGQQKGLFVAAAELKIFLLQNTYFIYAQIKDFQNFQISIVFLLKNQYISTTFILIYVNRNFTFWVPQKNILNFEIKIGAETTNQ